MYYILIIILLIIYNLNVWKKDLNLAKRAVENCSKKPSIKLERLTTN